MENSGKNGNTVLLTVIGVATLLVALVGATFAYFSASVSNEQAQSVSLTTATPVSLIYVAAAKIEITNAIPGATDTKTFTVTNPASSTTEQTYDLTLVVDTNGFVTTDAADQLEITVSSSTTTQGKNAAGITVTTTLNTISNSPFNVTDGTTTAAPASTHVIVNDQRIAIGEVQTYTVVLTFKETNSAQDTNQGKSFAAHIDISDPVSVG